MSTETHLRPASLRGQFVQNESREAGDRRWEDARRRHQLHLGKDVPEHPANRSHGHYDIAQRLDSMSSGLAYVPATPDAPSRWYPVGKCLLESYGDLRYRICMFFAMPGMAFDGTFEEARRSLRNKQTGAQARSRLVNFGVVENGSRVERYSATGRKDRLAITHEVLGFEVRDSGSSAEALWCPEGLAQARTVLGEINGSDRLLGTGLIEGGVLLINEAEYRVLADRDFDRGGA
jgi:hypothetical protein